MKRGDARSGRVLKVALATLFVCLSVGAVGYSLRTSGLIPDPFAPGSISTPTIQHHTPPPIVPRQLDLAVLTRHQGPSQQADIERLDRQILAEYDRTNTKDKPWYEDGRQAARLYAIYLAGGDNYGEGILQNADLYVQLAKRKGCGDPFIQSICDVFFYKRHYAKNMQTLREQIARVKAVGGTGYPAICKAAAIGGLLQDAGNVDPKEDAAFAAMPEEMTPIYEMVAPQFPAMAAQGYDAPLIRGVAAQLSDACESNATLLDAIIPGMEKALADIPLDPAQLAIFRGEACVDRAWGARGTGWANTVTQDGWRDMKRWLEEASDILSKAAEDYPTLARIPADMIKVELGQGEGKYRMNLWFDKAVKADPDYCQAYSRKMYYLQPKWYGTPDEVFAFGLECARTEKWEAKIPLVLIDGLETMGEQFEQMYRLDPVWDAAKQVLTKFVELYPDSISYRTRLLKFAVKSKHWKEAREQLASLGDNWDRLCLFPDEYEKIKKEVAQNP